MLRERLGGRRLHPTDAQRRRLAVKGRALGRKLLASVCSIVTPDTILRWYRELAAKKYDGAPKRGPGRANTKPVVVELVLTMACENLTWAYTRIRGALFELGDLALLAPDIQEAILFMEAVDGVEPLWERSLRGIVGDGEWEGQRGRWGSPYP